MLTPVNTFAHFISILITQCRLHNNTQKQENSVMQARCAFINCFLENRIRCGLRMREISSGLNAGLIVRSGDGRGVERGCSGGARQRRNFS